MQQKAAALGAAEPPERFIGQGHHGLPGHLLLCLFQIGKVLFLGRWIGGQLLAAHLVKADVPVGVAPVRLLFLVIELVGCPFQFFKGHGCAVRVIGQQLFQADFHNGIHKTIDNALPASVQSVVIFEIR